MRASDLGLTLTPLELADLPVAQQLARFRHAAILTGMHGAGYANIIFMAPGSVVAELCPLGYCTQSYERISARLDLTYMRWTNSIAENAKPGYDTIVDVAQFIVLMRRAVDAWWRFDSSTRGATTRDADEDEQRGEQWSNRDAGGAIVDVRQL